MTVLILSHESALSFWRSPDAASAHESLSASESGESLAGVSRSIRSRLLLELEKSGALGEVPFPLDLLSSDRGDRRLTRLARIHCIQTALPEGSLIPWKELEAGDEAMSVLVSSPEFCFVQMARRLDAAGALQLGCELCGSYRIAESDPRGYAQARPLTTPAALERYTDAATQMTGAKTARRLARHVLAGSRSPQQTKLALMASLPRSLGGVGAPAPKLAHRIEVPDDVARVLGSRTRVPDLFWPQIRTAVELDTRHWNDAAARIDYEERKADAYHRMGIDVVSVSKAQLESLEAMRRLFEIIARRCGKRRKPVNERQAARQESTHRALFAAE